eukprot:2252658-Alexandrium_andersonii.AAC.1
MWQPVAERLRAKLALAEESQLVVAAASSASSSSEAVPTGQMVVAAGGSDAVACAPRQRRRKFSEDEYRQMSHAVIVDLLVQRDAHIDDLRRNVRRCQGKISKLKQRRESQMQLQQCRAQNTDAAIFSIDRKNSG